MRFTRIFIIWLCGLVGLAPCKSDKARHVFTEQPFLLAIQPFEGIRLAEVQAVMAILQEIYAPDSIILLEEIKLPPGAYTRVKSPRYRADKLIAYLKERKPKRVASVIGLTNRDISTTKRDNTGRILHPESKYADWGVFGLGYCPGPSCVVSTFRIGNGVSRDLFIGRLKKISAHEVGHTLGLEHCSDKTCMMTDAVESISTVDRARYELCDKCRRKIESNR